MNCLSFNRILKSDPANQSADFMAHAQECAACAAKAREAAAFERQLRTALEIDVPTSLAPRILLKRSFEDVPRRTTLRRSVPYAIAASVLLIAGLVAGFFFAGARHSELQRALITHIVEEPQALVSMTTVPPDHLKSMLRPIGAELTDDIGEVRSASLCYIRGKLVAHLVVEGRQAPVTILLMPEESVARRRAFVDGPWSGTLIPVRGGTMALVGRPGEFLEPFEERVRSAVRWQL